MIQNQTSKATRFGSDLSADVTERSCKTWDEWRAWFSSFLGLYHRISSRRLDDVLPTFWKVQKSGRNSCKNWKSLIEGRTLYTHTHIWFWLIFSIDYWLILYTHNIQPPKQFKATPSEILKIFSYTSMIPLEDVLAVHTFTNQIYKIYTPVSLT